MYEKNIFNEKKKGHRVGLAAECRCISENTIGTGDADFEALSQNEHAVIARQTPTGFCHVMPVLRNRRRRVAGGDTHGDGNSGHLKREPYPFQRQTQYLVSEFGFFTTH